MMFRFIINSALVLINAYFLFQTYNGNFGLKNRVALINEQTKNKKIMNELIAQKQELEIKIELLNPKNLDLDYLQELGYSRLGYVSHSDVIIFLKQK